MYVLYCVSYILYIQYIQKSTPPNLTPVAKHTTMRQHAKFTNEFRIMDIDVIERLEEITKLDKIAQLENQLKKTKKLNAQLEQENAKLKKRQARDKAKIDETVTANKELRKLSSEYKRKRDELAIENKKAHEKLIDLTAISQEKTDKLVWQDDDYALYSTVLPHIYNICDKDQDIRYRIPILDGKMHIPTIKKIDGELLNQLNKLAEQN